MNRIPFFRKNQDPPLTDEQKQSIIQQEEERHKEIEKNIINMAVALNSMINPGVTVIVDIKTGLIVAPGQPRSNSVIIFIKPAIMQTIRCQVTAPEPGNGKELKP